MGVQREDIAKGKTSEFENIVIGTIQHETEMLKKRAEHQCTLGQCQAV